MKTLVHILCLLAALLFPANSILAETVPLKDIRIVLHTDKGDIEATLFASKTPVTVANFLNLAQRKFYNGLTFHRVIAGFMIQGGDPLGNGAGTPGYQFGDEFVDDLTFNKPGIWAMANAGRATNGSQFFITHVPTPHLNGKHTIFGQTTKGQDVVYAVQQGDKIKTIDILDDPKPLFEMESIPLAKWNAILDKKP